MTPTPSSRPLRAGLVYFLLIFAAGFVLGVVRTLWLEPRLTPLTAVACELPVLLGLSWLVCARLVRAHGVPPSAGARIAMGVVAFGLLMLAELGLGLILEGGLGAVAGRFEDADRLLGLLGQIAFALIPLVQAHTGSGADPPRPVAQSG